MWLAQPGTEVFTLELMHHFNTIKLNYMNNNNFLKILVIVAAVLFTPLPAIKTF